MRRQYGKVWAMTKIEHYEFMLKELDLSDRHKYWIKREIERERAIIKQTKEFLFEYDLFKELSE